MKEEFDFRRIGKRLPYTIPEGLMSDIEKNVWKSIKKESTPYRIRRNYRLWFSIPAGLVAASAALLLIFSTRSPRPESDDLTTLEHAFTQLSNADQEYLLAVYQDDLFINE